MTRVGPEVLRQRQLRALELFEAVVELDQASRVAHLDLECAGDAELRSMVEGLLGSDVGVEALEAMPELFPSPETGLVGRRLGPWLVEGLLGRGGMATVYAGSRADGSYRQRVAIKVIRAGEDRPSLVKRFEEERHILARLDHPNIAKVLDGGSTEDGRPYVVMELVDGPTIDAHATAARLTLGERLRLLLSVCEAVEHAHRNLVVHRDIKPANILVAATGSPKLLDFGIAKVLEDEGDPELTQTGLRALTPSYASPEQVAGEPVATTSDVYSLGMLAYRLVVGALPYRLPDTRPETLRRIICEEAPVRPSLAVARQADPEFARAMRTTPRALARALSGDLDTILMRALAKRPHERYPSVEALREDLERHLDGRPVRARPPSVTYQLGRWARRHRWGVAVSACLILAIAGGVASTVWQARRATTEAAKLELTNGFLRDMLAAPNPRVDGREVSVAELLERASGRLDRDRSLSPALVAVLRRTLAQSYLGLGLYDEAEAEARAAVTSSERAGDAGDRAVSLVRLASVHTAERELETAEPIYREALAALPPTAVAAAEAHAGLAVLLSRSGREREAIPEFQRAIEIYRERGVDDTRYATALNDLGVAHGRLGELAEAEALHREAYQRMLRGYGAQHPGTGEALANLAGAVDAAGRHAEAEPLYREAVEIGRRTSGEDHPEVIALTSSRALNLRLLGSLAEAEAVAAEAVTAADRRFDEAHPLRAYAHYVLGEILLDAGRAEAALDHLQLAVEARRRSLPPGHWLVSSAEVGLGAALDHLGRDAEAEAMLTSAWTVLERDRGPTHERTVEALERLRQFYERRNRPEADRFRRLLAERGHD